MRRKLKENYGYSLLITFAVIILFSVLGLSLLSLTSSGVSKNTSRQDTVHAQTLSEKGLDYFIKEVNSSLNDSIKYETVGGNKRLRVVTLNNTTFLQVLEDTLISFSCDNTPNALSDTSTGTVEMCLDLEKDSNSNYVFEEGFDSAGQRTPLRKIVSIKSKGTSSSKAKQSTLVAKVEFGANPVPDVLKYTIGTNKPSINPQPGDGDLIMLGGTTINGDIKVEGNLITSTWIPGSSTDNWFDGVLPRMPLSIDNKRSKLLLLGDAYSIESSSRKIGVEKGTSPGSFLNSIRGLTKDKTLKIDSSNASVKAKKIDLQNNPEKIFHKDYLPSFHVKTAPSTEIDIEQAVTDKKIICTESSCNKGSLTTNWDVPNKNYVTSKDLHVKGNLEFSISEGNYAYINGDLIIGTNTANVSKLHPDDSTKLNVTDCKNSGRSNITLKGTFYVEGKVLICDSNVTADAVIYTKGLNSDKRRFNYESGYWKANWNGKTWVNETFSIEDLDPKGFELKKVDINKGTLAGSSGSLIVFSHQQIDLSDLSTHSNNPSVIKGFLHTDKEMWIYGKAAHILIDGGISGKRIMLYTIRGDYPVNAVPSADKQEGADYSRLTINYNQGIIKDFARLNQTPIPILEVEPSVIHEKALQ